MSEVQEKIKQIIVDELGVDEAEVTENARFIEDLGADSLDLVELVMRFEEEFDIEIPDEDAEKFKASAMLTLTSNNTKGKTVFSL